MTDVLTPSWEKDFLIPAVLTHVSTRIIASYTMAKTRLNTVTTIKGVRLGLHPQVMNSTVSVRFQAPQFQAATASEWAR